MATLVLVMFALAAVSGPAYAEDEDADREKARKLLERGDRFMRRGDQRRESGREKRAITYYERALESYQKAHELVPKTSIFYAIASAEAKLGRHTDALAHYQKVIAEVDNDELEEQARLGIQALAPHVATLTVMNLPEGAEIRIGGEPRGVAPLAEPLFLPPGDHTLTVMAEGYSPYEESLSLEAGSQIEREVVLEKIPLVVKEPAPSADEAGKDEAATPKGRKRVRRPSKSKLIIGGSATVALLAGATVTGLMAMSKHDTFTDPATNAEDRDSARSSGRALALITDILIVGTLAAGAYTTYQYLGVYRPQREAYEQEQKRREDPNFWLSTYIDGKEGGLAVGWRF